MNKGKSVVIGTVFGLAAALYYILIFTLTSSFQTGFWVGFAFVTLAIIVCAVSVLISNSSKHEGKVTGLSLNVQSFMYLGLELILASVFMWWKGISFKACFIPQIVLLIIFLMLYIPSVYNYFNIEKHNNKL